MHDIQKLEAQWRWYKRRQIFRPLFATLGIVATGALVYYAWPILSAKLSSESAKSDHAANTAAAVPSQNTTIQTPLSTKAALPVVPLARRGSWEMSFAGAELPKPQSESTGTKQVDIEVQSRKSEHTAKEIEERFRFAKDKDDALFLARFYYDKKQYKEALKWSLETNKLDSDIEESWLLFAQSKAKLGQRKEAIRVLQAYYDRTGSAKSKKLLDHIRRGKVF
jgi:tetratricopeptide (TPR) repeat protein